MANLQQIFDWFKTGMFPTETQFAETFSSFWHKSERIPGTSIEGLPVNSGQDVVKIWVGPREDLPATEARAGSKTIYIALDEEPEGGA
jgi:hypothetical protein